MRMAEVFTALGEIDRARALQHKAGELRDRFEAQFWCEELGYYAYGLDATKKPIESIVSNPGHCLWSGIVSPARAARVVDRLMAPDLWSGWGIRTISADHPSFNPDSLPTWLPDLNLRQISIGNATVELRFWREDDRTHWAADVRSGEIEVIQKSWQPW
jgi:glycogen debranching enzyme